MGFLSDLDALPAGNLARTVLFYQWVRRHWRALFVMRVKAGSVIMASIGSAMFAPDLFPDPDTFLTRRRTAYLYTGFGPHECLGQYVAYAIIPETIRHLLMLPGIRLLDGGVDRHGGRPVRRAFRSWSR
jgi:hypothetical protein